MSLIEVSPWVLAEVGVVERAGDGAGEGEVGAGGGGVGRGEVGCGRFGGRAFGGDEAAGGGGGGTDAAVGFPDVAVAAPVGGKEGRGQ